MPIDIWDTSLPDTDVDLYKLAVDEQGWKNLLLEPFFSGLDDPEDSWGVFWEGHGNNLLNSFNYQDTYGPNESLTRRSFSKGLDLLRSSAYGKMNTQARNRANVGFAGAGGGLGLYKGAPSLWNDYQMSLQEKRNSMVDQLYGYGQQHKSNVNNYISTLAQTGAFDEENLGG